MMTTTATFDPALIDKKSETQQMIRKGWHNFTLLFFILATGYFL